MIERHHVPIAVIGPAAAAPRRISECLAVQLPKASVAPDPGFAADLMDIIRGRTTDEPPAWG